jgi:putative DNA methylase
VTCANPACGGQMPLVSSFDLSTKRGKAWVEPIVDQAAKTVRFTVKSGNGSAPPPPKISRGANFRCLICGSTADPQHLKDEGMAKRMGAQLMAIVAEGSQGRAYLSPSDEHSRIAFSAHASWRPEQDLPYEPRAIWCTLYGLTMHADLFTERQLVALTTFSDLVGEAQARVLADAIAAGLPNDGAPLHEGGTGAPAYAAAVATYLALTISRWADLSNSLCGWNSTNGNTRALFARQAIPMVWDFAEQNPFGRTGSFESTLQNCVDLMDRSPSSSVSQAEVQQLNATALSADREFAICTDPPYYDNIGYADLSDFFYVWLRRSLRAVHPDLFKTMLVPKSEELVASPYRHGGSKGAAEAFFEKGLGEAFDVMRVIQSLEFPMAVYYAYKQSEQVDDGADGIQASTGWETMLSGLLGSGFEITGTWPMRTERAARSVGLHTNALASSIIIVCRPRHETAEVVSRGQFIAALRRELPDALIRLQQGNIAPVDLQQSVIGPGMAVYSRYARVENADGTPVKIRAALQIINAELDAFLDNQIGELDSDTAFCVKWFEQYQFNPGRFGDADNLARARNTSASGLQAAGCSRSTRATCACASATSSTPSGTRLPIAAPRFGNRSST